MKILFLSQIVPYPPHGGVLQRGYNLLREISKNNKIHLLAFMHPDILITDEMIEESRRELTKFCEKIEYFPLWPKRSIFHRYFAVSLSFLSCLPFSVLAHRSRVFRNRFIELMWNDEFDLLHFDTIALTQFDNTEIRVPKVLTHHNIESQLMARRGQVEKNPFARLYLLSQAEKLKRYEVNQSSNFDLNIMMSELDSNQLKRLIPNVSTSIVPNGVDIEYFCPMNIKEIPALIYTGGMNMFANKDAVLFFLNDIWPRIKVRIPNVKFYAVGQDPPAELYNIGKKDLQIEITGYVDDIRPYVAKSSVYVVPLRVGGGTRLKVLDAMAMGKAIVSTSIGCEGIEITPGENILLGDDPLSFAEKTIDLLQNSEKREYLGKAARKLVEGKYSWEIIGKKLQESYKKVVNMKRKSQVIEDEYRFKKAVRS